MLCLIITIEYRAAHITESTSVYTLHVALLLFKNKCFYGIFVGPVASYAFYGIPGLLELKGPRLQPSQLNC